MRKNKNSFLTETGRLPLCSRLLLTLAGLAIAPSGSADPEPGFYLGVGGGYSTLAPDKRDERWQTVVDEGEVYRLLAGYEFAERLFVEIDYLDLGEAWAVFDPLGRGVDYRAAGVSMGVLARPFDRRWNAFLRAGGGRVRAEMTRQPNAFSAGDSSSFLLGGGIQWTPSDQWWGRVEWVSYEDDPQLYLFSVGYRIGATSRFRYRYTDHDGDGVIDKYDLCPNTRAETAVDKKGCTLDMDRDGVADSMDDCLDSPIGMTVNERGCAPDREWVQRDCVAGSQDCLAGADPVVEVTLNILFDTGSALIKPTYRADIARLAQVLADYPESQIVIEGHTDNRGDADANQRLSVSRARAVAQMLIAEYNIASDRVSAVGYGETRPVQDDSDEQAYLLNRRVVAKVYSD